jgi:hypothetical protein
MGWLIAGLMIGPILYILLTLTSRRPSSVDDYQFGERRLNPSDVVDASIMYGLQIAAISLFATWGFQFGVAALVVPLFWVLGYFLICVALSNRFLENFAKDSEFRTLHGFLADHGRVRSIRITAALLTLVGLAGPAMVEAFTVGRAIGAAIPTFGDVGGAGLALGFLAVSLIYMTSGGFPGVVKLNQFQMMFGYGGLCASIAGLMLMSMNKVGSTTTFSLALCCLLASVAMLVIKIRHDRQTHLYLYAFHSDSGTKQTLDVMGLAASSIGAIAFLIVVIISYFSVSTDPIDAQKPAWLGTSTGYGFTLLATISLFVANAFYQFVDVTQWQRLVSLSVNKNNLSQSAAMLRSNILNGGIGSSLTWVIAILFGVFLRSLFPDPDANPYTLIQAVIAEVLQFEGAWSGPLIFILVASLLAIMFSTLDAIVSATSFTVQEDLIGIDRARASVFLARTLTVGVVFVQLMFYLGIGFLAGDRVDAVLYICWSFQLAMMPVVAGLILGRGGSYPARFISLISGATGALLPLMLGTPDRAYEISPIMAFSAALVAYVLLGGAKKLPTAAV